MSVQDPPLVFSFKYQHAVGSICGVPCAQCGETTGKNGVLMGPNAVRLPPQPMFIVREATVEEWKASVIHNGGDATNPRRGGWFYVVSTD